ncbi:MAG: flagellar protein FliT [Gammaproteobacteria bacterium]
MLDAIVSQTLLMLKNAREASWEEVFRIEEERRALIGRFFEKPANPEQAARVSEGIELVRKSDREIMALAVVRKNELGAGLEKMTTGRKAVKAYTS